MFERPVTIEPGKLDARRRTVIGAQVLTIEFMRRTSQYIRSFRDANDNGLVFSEPVDSIAQKIMYRLDDKEYAIARKELLEAKPDSQSHIARQHMNLASKSFEHGANKAFLVNANFVVATHYLEDRTYAEKINAEISVDELIDHEQEAMVEFYTDKAIRNIRSKKGLTNLRDIVATTTHDISYWLN